MSSFRSTIPLNQLAQREFRFQTGVTFLNHASFGPVPESGRRAVEELLDRQGRIGSDPDVDSESFQMLADAKRLFARLVGQSHDRVAFAPSTSFGLNSILWGLNFRSNERILISEVEFPAVVYAVRHIAQARHLKVEVIPCPTGHMDLDQLKRSLRRTGGVLALSWVQFCDGYRYDLKAISDLCHAQGCFVLIDAIQGIGAVPLNWRKSGIDALSCGTQKWLFGQSGGGFFAISKDTIRPVDPPYAGWLGYDWGYRWDRLQRHDRPRFRDGRRWEVGSYPYYSLRLAHAGLSILQEAGIGNVYRRITSLIDRLNAGLDGSPFSVKRAEEDSNRSGICTIAGPRMRQLHQYLEHRLIYTSLREGTIRVSPHFHNTDNDMDRLVEAAWSFARQVNGKFASRSVGGVTR